MKKKLKNLDFKTFPLKKKFKKKEALQSGFYGTRISDEFA